jgi:hypothetical protein
MPDRKMGPASDPISTLPKRFAGGELVILEERATLDAGSCRGLAVVQATCRQMHRRRWPAVRFLSLILRRHDRLNEL